MKHLALGKHFVWGFCSVVLLTFGLNFFSEQAQARVPVPPASAQHWWRRTGPGPGPMGAGADQKAQSAKQHTGKAQLEKPTPLYTSPKSVGWWQKGPGPLGAGADENFRWNFKWTWPHFRKAQREKLTPLYASPKSVGWWHKSAGPLGAGSGN